MIGLVDGILLTCELSNVHNFVMAEIMTTNSSIGCTAKIYLAVWLLCASRTHACMHLRPAFQQNITTIFQLENQEGMGVPNAYTVHTSHALELNG